MELDRKRLVRAVFDKMDIDNRGYVTEMHIRGFYRCPSPVLKLPAISGRTVQTAPPLRGALEDASEVLDFMYSVDSAMETGRISWSAFLDYYRCISLGLEKTEAFEEFLRSTWFLPGIHSARSSPMSVSDLDGRKSITSAGEYLMSKARAVTPITVKVTVTKANGEQEQLDFRDDLGTMRYNLPSMQRSVSRKGVRDIARLSW